MHVLCPSVLQLLLLFERPRLINIIEHLLVIFKDDRTLRKSNFYYLYMFKPRDLEIWDVAWRKLLGG